jgi:glycerol-3-phosphate acyltransferase PlsY
VIIPLLLDLPPVETSLALALAYLLGSIDTGVIVPRLLGVNIYEHGSGNPGASNVMRTMGKKAGAAVMLGDAIKGLLAALVGAWMVSPTVGFWCALAAVVGHVYPVWHRFKGGRGVATAIGAVLYLEPWFGLVLVIGWGGTVATTKTASIASLGAMAVYVPGYALFGWRGWPLVAAGLTAGLVIARHSGNIKRLLGGREQTVETQ